MRNPGSPWALLCALLASIGSCGGRTALDSADYLAGGAGARSSGASGAGSRIDPAVCARFAPLWDSRAGSTTLRCDTCFRDGGCGWPDTDVCTAGTRCVDRKCSVLGDLATLCACIESCFSDDQRECDQRWSTFMTCATSACDAACALQN